MEKVYLCDIGGYEEEKKEVTKIIEILKNYKEYEKIGAYVPKGLALSGVPGVGKTMFAKAIATESGVPIFSLKVENDEKDEIIKKIKDIYTKARAKAPSIVFIDELDELISNHSFISDNSRSILKALLSELDGEENNSNVLTIVTTNLGLRLPSSILRSGRIDRHISFDVPNLDSRTAIFDLYLRKNDLLKDINSKALAKKTQGFTGADIKTLINETLIECKINNVPIVLKEFVKKIPEISFKNIRKKNTDGDKKEVLYHEIGHFIADYRLFDSIGSICTDRFGEVAGHVHIEDDDETFEKKILPKISKKSLPLKLQSFLAGMAAEEIFTGDISTGATNDVGNCYMIIKTMMNLGAFGFDKTRNSTSSISLIALEDTEFSQNRIVTAENFADSLMNKAYEDVKKLLVENTDLVNIIFNKLEDRQNLDKAELEDIIEEFNSSNKR